jgi:hypothetical protein
MLLFFRRQQGVVEWTLEILFGSSFSLNEEF